MDACLIQLGYTVMCFPPDFDKRVNDNKTAAEDALRKIPAITQTILEANNKTHQAEVALGNAAADAREAKNKADSAEKMANSVQKVSLRRSHISIAGNTSSRSL